MKRSEKKDIGNGFYMDDYVYSLDILGRQELARLSWSDLRYVFSLIQQKNDNLFFHFKVGYRLSLLKTPQTSLKKISPKPLKKL